jgi:predicted nucleic acid-binding protein
VSVALPSVVVVDVSLALKWVLQEDFTAEAEALHSMWQHTDTQPVVPSWFACEAANALHQQVYRGYKTVRAVQTALRVLLRSVEVRDYDPALSLRAIEIASQVGQRQSYDSHYVALAEHEGCELWTADRGFWTAAAPRFPQVNWVGNVRV